jgi:hypothetical protein
MSDDTAPPSGPPVPAPTLGEAVSEDPSAPAAAAVAPTGTMEAPLPNSRAGRPKRSKRRPRSTEARSTTEATGDEPSARGFAGRALIVDPNDSDESVPAFARAWPRDTALDRLVAAFEAGDYARVRREAPRLARRTESDTVRRAARELGRRLDPDPVAVYMLMAAAALLVFLAGWYWLHPYSP